MKKLIILAVCLFIGINIYAQDKLVRLSGDTLKKITIDSITKDLLFYKNAKGKLKKVDIVDVFYISKKGKDSITYKKDSLLGYDLTIDQMSRFIKGESDASKRYTNKFGYIGGGIIGAIGGFVGFYGVPLPALYALGTNYFEPNIKKADPIYKGDQNYMNGYKGKVKSMRIKRVIISGAIGFVVLSIVKVFR